MRTTIGRLFNDREAELRSKVAGIYVVLIGANVLVWVWALIAFRDYPVLVGTAFLAYTFGLRHAVDADHIAAIDNVTRKLMQEGKRPVSVGLFFSLGHSTVVVLASAAIALATGALARPLRVVQAHRRRDRHAGFGRAFCFSSPPPTCSFCCRSTGRSGTCAAAARSSRKTSIICWRSAACSGGCSGRCSGW